MGNRKNEAIKKAIFSGDIWKKDWKEKLAEIESELASPAEEKGAEKMEEKTTTTTTTVTPKTTSATATKPAVTTPATTTKPATTTPTTTTKPATTTTTPRTTTTRYSVPTDNYNFRGVKNKTKFPKFVEICKLNQKLLKIWLEIQLMDAGYEDIVTGDGYIYAKGTHPVLLTAHMDTVHKEDVKDFFEFHDKEKKRHIISSPQGIGGDDRCGVYMILEIIKTHKCSVLFCEDEEIGCVGSGKFVKEDIFEELKELKYMIELDRKGNNDAVFYSCDSKEFTKFIEDNTGYKKAWGSCSDISTLAPKAKIAAVNLSCGYHNAHSISEYVVIEEMMNTIKVVKELLDVECEQFEYVAKTYGGNYGGTYGGYYGRYYDDYDDYDGYYGRKYGGYGGYGGAYGGYGSYQNTSSANKTNYRTFYIYIYTEDKVLKTFASNATNAKEALGKFFIANPDMCYNDVHDYEDGGTYVITDGWFGL